MQTVLVVFAGVLGWETSRWIRRHLTRRTSHTREFGTITDGMGSPMADSLAARVAELEDALEDARPVIEAAVAWRTCHTRKGETEADALSHLFFVTGNYITDQHTKGG